MASSNSWIPTKEQDLVPFAQNYSAKITAAPTTYGLVAADATALATLVTAFTTALTAATTPATRTPVTVTAKDVAKASLLADMRALAKRIQATLSVTPDQKAALGLPIHKTTQTPIPAPTTKPVMTVLANGGRTVTVLIKDETTQQKKAKPFGVEGAEIYSYVPTGTETPPADLTEWRFEGIATRANFDIPFRPADVAKTAYVVARWFNPKGDTGPQSDEVIVPVAA